MKKSRFTISQIMEEFKRVKFGLPVPDWKVAALNRSPHIDGS